METWKVVGPLVVILPLVTHLQSARRKFANAARAGDLCRSCRGGGRRGRRGRSLQAHTSWRGHTEKRHEPTALQYPEIPRRPSLLELDTT